MGTASGGDALTRGQGPHMVPCRTAGASKGRPGSFAVQCRTEIELGDPALHNQVWTEKQGQGSKVSSGARPRENFACRRRRTKGSPETVGFRRTFPRFSCGRKPGPRRGGETALKQAECISLGAAHRLNHLSKPNPRKGKRQDPGALDKCRTSVYTVYIQKDRLKEKIKSPLDIPPGGRCIFIPFRRSPPPSWPQTGR